MAQVGRSISRAGVIVDIVDVGGGFPSVYPGMVPPDMSEYADAIHRGFNEMPVSETTELWCEPGRALVAESSSVLWMFARRGVVVAPSVWWRKFSPDGRNANSVTSQRIADLGGGATFYDCLVEVEKA